MILPWCDQRPVAQPESAIKYHSVPADPRNTARTLRLAHPCAGIAPAADLAKLGAMNAKLDPRGRWDAVMKEDGLFEVETVP
jgi:hypothetical protein